MDIVTSIKSANEYRKLFKKWPRLVYSIAREKFPVTVETRNDQKITLNNRAQAWIIREALSRNYNCAFVDDTLILPYKNREIRLSGLCDKRNPRFVNGDPIHVFIEEDYWYLKGAGDVCVDIGANIGDSSIWLALNGFSRVIAVEPYPQNFVNPIKNVKDNALEKSIICINKGLSSSRKDIDIDDSSVVAGGFDLHESKEGSSIELVNLDDLLELSGGSSVCLKMDCEGCEYDSILNANCGTLLKFRRIMIEYHYGFESLETKLKKCGFNVKHTLPHVSINPNASNKRMITGFIYASLEGT